MPQFASSPGPGSTFLSSSSSTGCYAKGSFCLFDVLRLLLTEVAFFKGLSLTSHGLLLELLG